MMFRGTVPRQLHLRSVFRSAGTWPSTLKRLHAITCLPAPLDPASMYLSQDLLRSLERGYQEMVPELVVPTVLVPRMLGSRVWFGTKVVRDLAEV